MQKDTIFALATPLAKSGVAVIRVSGPQAKHTLAAFTGHNDWKPGQARICTLRAPDGTLLDKALALYFAAPKSFSGEDIIELQTHGSLGVIRSVLNALSEMDGLRHAEPGEFTRRAYLNGKMDLLEAEGLADLIDAETPAQQAQALSQLGGGASQYYEEIRARIVECLALLEAYIDFPDEEIPESALKELRAGVIKLEDTIERTLADNQRGERLREGIRVVILGEPNVGKSSLLNALSKRDAAIVSEQAGTTRDAIEVHLNLKGFPVILTDTAGLRATGDTIEEEGVRRAERKAGEADITLLLFDATQPLHSNAALKHLDPRSIVVFNKCDLPAAARNQQSLFESPIVHVSVKTGEGVDALLGALENQVSKLFSSGLTSVITRARHRDLLKDALSHLARFSPQDPIEISCEELRQASLAIGKITGKIAVDEVLDVVFSRFCIGK